MSHSEPIGVTAWDEWLDRSIEGLARHELLRRLRPVTPKSPVHVEMDGRRLTLFSSNDYLGLSQHPAVRRAMSQAVQSIGLGPRGSPLICGYTTAHQALESEIAALKGCEEALLFPTGYAANMAVICALAGAGTTIYSDELNHASIIDGCRLARRSGARLEVFRHLDIESLADLLQRSDSERHLIVTETVFSMDGDLAPLPQLVELKRHYGALLVVDEAHATLVFGKGGGGLTEHFDLSRGVDVQVGTLSKAVGALGGFAATSARLKTLILNRGRPYIYSTATPLPVAEAARAAIRVAQREPEMRQRLWGRIAQLGEILGLQLSSPILPIVLGEERRALAASRRLLEKGLHVVAIRPPTVAPGTSRLRVALSAAHSPDDIEAIGRALKLLP